VSLGEVWRRIVALVRREEADEELRREMRAHLERLAEDAREEGADAQAALDAARRQFGNERALREAVRDASGWTAVDLVLRDVRFGVRSLRRDWRFTLVALAVLTLGIAGNVTVFSVVNALLLNPFPYPHAERLVEVQWQPRNGAPFSTVRVADFGYWRDHARSYDALAAYGWARSNLTAQDLPGLDAPERILVGRATEGFLRVLGVRPSVGRFFTADEDRPGGPPVVVLSHGAWQRRFGARADIIGRTMTLDGEVRSIVGVMPASLPLPGTFTCEVWVPSAFDVAANMRHGYDTRYDGDSIVGRLRDDVGVDRAQSELALMVRQLDQALRREEGAWSAHAVRLGQDLDGADAKALRLLSAVVGVGLLLACVNVAGLLVARGGARSREMAVRAALGGSRLQLVRAALVESLALSCAGGLLGILGATWGVSALGKATPAHLGLDSALRIDGTVLAFAVGLSLATGIVFGLLPALHASKTEITAALKGASRAGRTRRAGRLLSAIVVTEVALALLLLVGGGLVTRSLVRLVGVDNGLRPEGLLTFRVSLAGSRYDTRSRCLELYSGLIDRLRRHPAVISAAGVSPLPMSREYSGHAVGIEGRPTPVGRRPPMAQICQATPGYFRTIGTPVLLGREFEDADASDAPGVVVNEAFARAVFPGESPLGHRVVGAGTIVGVVGDIRHNGPSHEAGPQGYLSVAALPPRTLSIVLRTNGDPMALAPIVRTELRALDPELPVDRLAPMSAVVAESLSTQRIAASLVGGFGLFALALATMGLYGVVAYAVSRRRREIGLRVALGASPGRVSAMVVAQGSRLAAAGVLIGLPAALACVKAASSSVAGIEIDDPLVFVSVPLVLLGASLLASYVPARSAARVDPLNALRTE
jgi:putative ABC transport system permease protein